MDACKEKCRTGKKVKKMECFFFFFFEVIRNRFLFIKKKKKKKLKTFKVVNAFSVKLGNINFKLSGILRTAENLDEKLSSRKCG